LVPRVVPVDSEAYDVVSDGLINFFVDIMMPLTSPTTGDKKIPASTAATALDDAGGRLRAYLAADDQNLTQIQVAKLLAAVCFRMHEKAHVSMAEKELGAGQFDDDVKAVRAAAETYALPQQISAAERQLLDVSKVDHNRLGSRKRYRTRTKLFDLDVKDYKGELSGQLAFKVRAPAAQVVTYFMARMPLFYAKTTASSNLTIVERENDHSMVSKMDIEMPYPLQNRELVTRTLWEKVGDGGYFISQTSCGHPACPESPEVVRMVVIRTIKLDQISPSLTDVKSGGRVHLGGFFPSSVNNSVTFPLALSMPPHLMMFFAAVRLEHEFDDGDSTELGQLAVHHLYPFRDHPDVLREEVNKMISVISAFRVCQAKYRFLDEFLFHIMMNSTKGGAAQTGFIVGSHLDVLTANEAGQIARSFPMVLMSNANGASAVDEFIYAFPALEELDYECNWFRPSMVAIASELMSKVAYGVKVRAGIGGAISILDLVSDIVIIVEYIGSGRMEFAFLLIGMVGCNLLFQLFIVWLQSEGLKEDKWKVRIVETVGTLLFLKPGFDAWKVAGGEEQRPGAAFGPLQEMSFSKAAEMVFESIPGLIIQCVAIIGAERRSKTAIASLLLSGMSTGLTATTVFYDIDADPGMRKRNPKWCGVIPNQGRGVAFGTV
jgi:hypothetical protein